MSKHTVYIRLGILVSLACQFACTKTKKVAASEEVPVTPLVLPTALPSIITKKPSSKFSNLSGNYELLSFRKNGKGGCEDTFIDVEIEKKAFEIIEGSIPNSPTKAAVRFEELRSEAPKVILHNFAFDRFENDAWLGTPQMARTSIYFGWKENSAQLKDGTLTMKIIEYGVSLPAPSDHCPEKDFDACLQKYAGKGECKSVELVSAKKLQ